MTALNGEENLQKGMSYIIHNHAIDLKVAKCAAKKKLPGGSFAYAVDLFTLFEGSSPPRIAASRQNHHLFELSV